MDLVIDHKVPWSLGGETVMENLQALCTQCNGGKSDL
jgi:5-methylcytosine-specific restriction endonuclease McrA